MFLRGNDGWYGKQIDMTDFVDIACNELQQMKEEASHESAPVPMAGGR